MSWGEILYLKSVIDGKEKIFVPSNEAVGDIFRTNAWLMVGGTETKIATFTPKYSGWVNMNVRGYRSDISLGSYGYVNVKNQEGSIIVYHSTNASAIPGGGAGATICFEVEKNQTYSVTAINMDIKSITILASAVDPEWFNITSEVEQQ